MPPPIETQATPGRTLDPSSTHPLGFTRICLWIAVAIGAFHAAYASASASLLVLLYVFALLQLAQGATWRRAFYPGLVVGLLIAAGRLAFFWRIFGGGAVALWLVYAVWIGLFVALVRLCLRRPGSPWSWALIPFVWVGLEYFRSELYYLRFSWLNLGYAFAAAPWQVPFGHLGTYGVGFLLVSLAAVAAFWSRKSLVQSLVFLSILAGGIWFGGSLPKTEQPPPAAATLHVAGVQMEFPLEHDVLARLDDLLRQQPDTELVVLSEYTFCEPVTSKVKEWCCKHRRFLVVGGKEPAPGGNFYNTAFVIGPDGQVAFRQAKAVPIQFFKDGLPAPNQKVWDSPWGKIGICVCYDLSYTRVTDQLVRQGAQAIIVPTMDVMDWGQGQHELHARVAPVRAAEYGLPIFRLASSGISQCTERTGRVVAAAPSPGEGAILAGTLALGRAGELPLDRWLAPLAVAVTALLMMGSLVTSLPSLAGTIGSPGMLPVVAFVVRWLLRRLYRFQAFNEVVLNTPGPVLLLPNHVSWWDWLLVGVCLEDDWRFVTSSTTADLSWLHRRIMVNRRTFAVDMNSPYAVKRMAEYLQHGGRLVLFPEGRISSSGSLMKLFDGTGFLIFKTHAKVITAYIRGGQHLPFSRSPGPKQWFPGLSVHFSHVLVTPPLDHVSTTAARARLTDWLRDQMVKQHFETEMAFGPATVPEAIAVAVRRNPRHILLQDVTLQQISGRQLLVGADLLAARWRSGPREREQRIGVLLPNVNAFPVVLLSLWAAGQVPAILNYSSGPAILLTCAKLAGLTHIITSKAFIERARLDLGPLRAGGLEFIFLEDLRARITPAQKLLAWLRQLARPGLSSPGLQASDTAVILFTSGSEGSPKGVELTHRNLLANIHQMLSVIDLLATDRFFNALPLFHSFGLTIGLLLPMTDGVFVLLYPTPLHYRVIPSAFYNLDCTLFFGTNTFLNGYARKGHPYDFRTLRYVFAAGEKLQEATATLWMHKFGIRVLEGYGATECSPCLSVNLPMRPRHGSVGQLLPGIESRVEPVEGVEHSNALSVSREAPSRGTVLPLAPAAATAPSQPASPSVGRLFVRGPNVMRGYLNQQANAKFQALEGWYDTGDIVRIDADGYLFILGRLKRFAKISGEMVSLTAVEDALAGAFPQYGLRFAVAVVAKLDPAKGERLVAFTNEPRLTLEELRDAIRAHGLNNLAVPRDLKLVRDLPRLGTGKVDHRELESMV